MSYSRNTPDSGAPRASGRLRRLRHSTTSGILAIRRLYVRGLVIVPFGSLSCFVTGCAGALANAILDGWQSSGGWLTVARRVAVGYVGALAVVLLLLPFLHVLFVKVTQRVASDKRPRP